LGPINIVPAVEADVPVILALIRALADYERLTHLVSATEADLHTWVFGPQRIAEVVLARAGADAVGFALFFHNFSTFLGRPGLYLEDLFVVPEWRGRGVGQQLIAHLANIAVARNSGRMEWSVLEWNEPAVRFYTRIGAVPMLDWRTFRLEGEALTHVAQTRRG
jgi:GNAT superfamily N-acetyltransferase